MFATIEETHSERQIPERHRSVELTWFDVCFASDIDPGTGAAVLLAGQQVALIRSGDGVSFHALGNFDPFSKAFVIARGIVGDRGGVSKIASPIFKQSFALDSGRCLDDESVQLPVYPVRLVAGRVHIAISREAPR